MTFSVLSCKNRAATSSYSYTRGVHFDKKWIAKAKRKRNFFWVKMRSESEANALWFSAKRIRFAFAIFAIKRKKARFSRFFFLIDIFLKDYRFNFCKYDLVIWYKCYDFKTLLDIKVNSELLISKIFVELSWIGTKFFSAELDLIWKILSWAQFVSSAKLIELIFLKFFNKIGQSSSDLSKFLGILLEWV